VKKFHSCRFVKIRGPVTARLLFPHEQRVKQLRDVQHSFENSIRADS
jgi:hypothetical protein